MALVFLSLTPAGNILVEQIYTRSFCAIGAICFSPLLSGMHIQVLHLREKAFTKSVKLRMQSRNSPNIDTGVRI